MCEVLVNSLSSILEHMTSIFSLLGVPQTLISLLHLASENRILGTIISDSVDMDQSGNNSCIVRSDSSSVTLSHLKSDEVHRVANDTSLRLCLLVDCNTVEVVNQILYIVLPVVNLEGNLKNTTRNSIVSTILLNRSSKVVSHAIQIA